ncbi:MAG: hypothetical protein ABI180_14345 [Microcoleus sp.]
MKDGNSDEKLVNFLKKYRPNVPEAAPDCEQRVLAAIDRNDQARKLNNLGNSRLTDSSKKSKLFGFPKWAFPPALAASVLVFWSGYSVLFTTQFHADEEAHLEAFMVNNWDGVLNDCHGENLLDRPQTDGWTFSPCTDSEQPTNN